MSTYPLASAPTPQLASSLQPTAQNRDSWQLAFENVWHELGFHHPSARRSRKVMLRDTWQHLSPRLANLQPIRPERHALLKYLWQDLSNGFDPAFMLTYHYKSPAEQGCSLQRPPLRPPTSVSSSRPCIYSHKGSVLTQVSRYSAIERRRSDIDLVSKDALHIRKILTQQFWRRTTPRQQRTDPHLYFFHELGRAKLQYHTHVLISMPPDPFTNAPAITQGWIEKILPKATNLSAAQTGVDVKELPDLFQTIGGIIYLTKETSAAHSVLDPHASLTLRGGRTSLPKAA